MSKLAFSVLLMLFSVLVASVSQILLKISANREHGSRLKEYLNPLVITAYGLLFGSTLLTMTALRHLPLSWSPVLESAGYIFVAVFGYFFLKEKFNRRKLAGLALILVGILVFAL